LATAIAASQKGLRVIVADGAQPPIDKPCGEGLMPEAQAALRELGLVLHPDAGVRFRGIRFVQQNAAVCAEFPQGQGVGMRRPLLHQLLLTRAEQCGVEFRWKTPVSAVTAEGVQLPQGCVAARWIIGADGGGSRVRRWSGLDRGSKRNIRHANRRHYRVRPWTDYMEIYWGARAQAYVTGISREEVCIVVMAEKPEEAKFANALENWPELKDRLAHAELASRERGAISSTQTLRRVTCGNVALVGDASGSVDPITGEGLRLSFHQALALAEALQSDNLQQYESAHRDLARRPTRMANLMLLLDRNPWLRERAIRALAAKPELLRSFLAIHTGAATPAQTISAGLRLSWQFLAI